MHWSVGEEWKHTNLTKPVYYRTCNPASSASGCEIIKRSKICKCILSDASKQKVCARLCSTCARMQEKYGRVQAQYNTVLFDMYLNIDTLRLHLSWVCFPPAHPSNDRTNDVIGLLIVLDPGTLPPQRPATTTIIIIITTTTTTTTTTWGIVYEAEEE